MRVAGTVEHEIRAWWPRRPHSAQDHLRPEYTRATICIDFPRDREWVPQVFAAVRGGGSRRAQGDLGDRPLHDLPARVRTAGRLPRAGAQPVGPLRPPRGPPLVPGRTSPGPRRLGPHPAGPGAGARERRRLRPRRGRRRLCLPLAHPAARLAGPGRALRGAPPAGHGRGPAARAAASGGPGLRALADDQPGRPAVDPYGHLAGADQLVRAGLRRGARVRQGRVRRQPARAALPHSHGPGPAAGGACAP